MQNLWNGWMIKLQKGDSLVVLTVSCIVWIMLKIKKNKSEIPPDIVNLFLKNRILSKPQQTRTMFGGS
ncbi:hypothetical protein C5F50_02565 [Nitrosopumilus ureiphilus]|uniref:Uncharacterized protein n=1 Tax=Nitrosopumilus ureiphilus TaxID=1470067 RepID=A0A7D5RCZ4_9ARCH|nr:hypothetical protein C5F50_02565 [Nitrosopumilus ureiphilus]